MDLRIATFNCENLFCRPKLLNFDDNRRARAPLEQVTRLERLLGKTRYTPTDKRHILRLLADLTDYIELNELRSKLLGTQRVGEQAVKIVRAEGRGDWVGGLRFKLDKLPLDAQRSTAALIKLVDADIQCLVEVESRTTLETFAQSPKLLDKRFPYNMLVDGNDPRGIDVGLLSKYPLRDIRSHVFDQDRHGRRIFSRDCLEVDIELPRGRTLHVLINHFKSQGYGTPQSNDARRKAQADRVVRILARFDLRRELVVVAGDFNAVPDHASISGLTRKRGLYDVLRECVADPRERWTYHDKKQLDYLLVSRALRECLVDAGVERRGMYRAEALTRTLSTGVVRAIGSVRDEKTDASDHAAVWADFRF